MEKIIDLIQHELLPHVMVICQDFKDKNIPLDDGLFVHTIKTDSFIADIDKIISDEFDDDTKINLVLALNADNKDETTVCNALNNDNHIMTLKLNRIVFDIHDIDVVIPKSDIKIPSPSDLEKQFTLG